MKTLLLLLIASATLSMAGCSTSCYQPAYGHNNRYQQSYPVRSSYYQNRAYQVDLYKQSGSQMRYEGYYSTEPVVLQDSYGRRYVGPRAWN